MFSRALAASPPNPKSICNGVKSSFHTVQSRFHAKPRLEPHWSSKNNSLVNGCGSTTVKLASSTRTAASTTAATASTRTARQLFTLGRRRSRPPATKHTAASISATIGCVTNFDTVRHSARAGSKRASKPIVPVQSAQTAAA